jgi:hypothetical protein
MDGGIMGRQRGFRVCNMLNANRVIMHKGWGFEDWIWNDEKYCGKKLFFIRHKHFSWHYHVRKDETFYLQSGRLLLVHSFDDCMDASTGRLLIKSGPTFPTLANDTWLTLSAQSGASFLVLEPGDSFHITPNLRHLMYALADSELFEFSTQHFEDDSYRVLKGD